MTHCRIGFPKWSVTFLATAVVVAAGCGRDGNPRVFTASGAVTFEGQPVPSGVIYFEPDTSRGNSGPQGMAQINNGRYQTLEGKGLVGGAYVVMIDGRRQASEQEAAAMEESDTWSEWDSLITIFPPHKVEVDFPLEDVTHDFNVSRSDTRKSYGRGDI